jgi:hypothetical protein
LDLSPLTASFLSFVEKQNWHMVAPPSPNRASLRTPMRKHARMLGLQAAPAADSIAKSFLKPTLLDGKDGYL